MGFLKKIFKNDSSKKSSTTTPYNSTDSSKNNAALGLKDKPVQDKCDLISSQLFYFTAKFGEDNNISNDTVNMFMIWSAFYAVISDIIEAQNIQTEFDRAFMKSFGQIMSFEPSKEKDIIELRNDILSHFLIAATKSGNRVNAAAETLDVFMSDEGVDLSPYTAGYTQFLQEASLVTKLACDLFPRN